MTKKQSKTVDMKHEFYDADPFPGLAVVVRFKEFLLW